MEIRPRKTTRRTVLAFVFSSAWLSLWPRRARADLIGDAGILLSQFAELVKLVQVGLNTLNAAVTTVKNTREAADAVTTAVKRAAGGNFEDILAAANTITAAARGIIFDLQGHIVTAKYWQNYFKDPEQTITSADVSKYRAARRDMYTHMRRQARAMNAQYATSAENAAAAQKRLNEELKGSDNDEGTVAVIQRGNRMVATIGAAQISYQQTATAAGLLVAEDVVERRNEEELKEKNTERFFKRKEDTTPLGPKEMPR